MIPGCTFSRTRQLGLVLLMGIVLLSSCLAAILTGSSHLAFGLVLKALAGQDAGTAASTIVWKIRVPRVILAATAGASLSLGGVVFQAILRNPLAEPYILGISGGAASGAIAGMLAGLSLFPGISVSALAGSLIALVVTFMVSIKTISHRDSLLLGGVMINSFCGALIMFLISMSGKSEVHRILFWLMGDLGLAEPTRLYLLLGTIPCFLVIYFLARPLNTMLMGRESAILLGVDVEKTSAILLVSASLMVSVIVCLSGLIGFVGLVVPHIFRTVVGPDHRLLVPACLLGGAAYLVSCDLAARVLPANGEIPVGVVTAMIGAPLFIILMWKGK